MLIADYTVLTLKSIWGKKAGGGENFFVLVFVYFLNTLSKKGGGGVRLLVIYNLMLGRVKIIIFFLSNPLPNSFFAY